MRRFVNKTVCRMILNWQTIFQTNFRVASILDRPLAAAAPQNMDFFYQESRSEMKGSSTNVPSKNLVITNFGCSDNMPVVGLVTSDSMDITTCRWTASTMFLLLNCKRLPWSCASQLKENYMWGNEVQKFSCMMSRDYKKWRWREILPNTYGNFYYKLYRGLPHDSDIAIPGHMIAVTICELPGFPPATWPRPMCSLGRTGVLFPDNLYSMCGILPLLADKFGQISFYNRIWCSCSHVFRLFLAVRWWLFPNSLNKASSQRVGHSDFLLYSLRILMGYRSDGANLRMPCKNDLLAICDFFLANSPSCGRPIRQLVTLHIH